MLSLIAMTVACAGLAEPLTKLEQAQGFKMLSGPDATSQWRGYKQPSFPAKGWKVTDGVLSTVAGGGGGDIITTGEYGDFELVLEYKTAPKANSGIMYRVTEKNPASYETGPEFQILDDVGNKLKPTDPHAAGALYDLYPPAEGKVEKEGDWNQARVWFRNGVVQHWLNGKKVVDANAFGADGKPTKEWLDHIAASKFKATEGFGVQTKGYLALQEHGDEVAFRNIKVRALDKPVAGEKPLFNGKDLTGWEAVVPDLKAKNEDQASVWSVKDGILICKGVPAGYIRTKDKYMNFILKVEWRFNPVTKDAGNSGVLFRMTGADKVWPKSIEAQLQSGSAGDFWNIDEVKMTVDPARTKGRNTKHTHAAERAVGEWNEYEIVVNHGDVILYVNGEELNRATNVEEDAGYICLQSEGKEIQFKSVRVVPLE